MQHPADDFLARARALLPLLKAREAGTTANREVSTATIADFHQAGMLRLLQPKRFGGAQGSFLTFSTIVEELASTCAASAWVYAVLGEHQWILSCFPEQAQIDVWGNTPQAVASSSLAPRHLAAQVEGGYMLNGDFPFSSGSLHAQWAILGVATQEADAGLPTRYLLAPMAELRRIDDWHVLGLQGTGSQSLRAENLFVPTHRSVRLSDLQAGTTPGSLAHPDFPLLRAPRDLLTPFSLPPVAFALARRAQQIVVPLLRQRFARATMPTYGTEFSHIAIAEADAELDMAHLLLHTRRQEAITAVETGQTIPTATILAVRRDIAFAQRHVRQAVERLCNTAGTHIVYDHSPLQTILRDVITIATHRVWSWERAMLPYGQWRLMSGVGEDDRK